MKKNIIYLLLIATAGLLTACDACWKRNLRIMFQIKV